MAMFYQGSSEIQADGLHTLYLMNPNYAAYSDNQQQPQPNMVFLNPATTTAAVHPLDHTSLPHAPLPQAQQFVGVPLSHDPTRPSPILGQIQEIPRFQYNLWGTVDGNHPNTPQRPQSLSLSLSPNQTGLNKQIPSDHHHHHHQDFSVGRVSSSPSLSTTTHLVSSPNILGVNNHVIMGSKYLKAAQQLLDEVASVGKGMIVQKDRAEPEKTSKDKSKLVEDSGAGEALCGVESGGKGELTTAQRQEIQMKKAKLINMLDEVEQRYRQYHHQMQMIVASFEQAAGIGSAKSYTQLALKTISKQFRCLKDAISSQIKALSKILGEEDQILIGEKFEMSRLRYVDNHLRQQRAMQQLGMIQNDTWRPQRGLPERAVSVLRAWLFEHFLHPYPKDSDKQMLAKQTGLTRGQVSNWFINARVRLWKPMVEEMYQEEIKNNQDKVTSDHLHENTSTNAAGIPAPDKESKSKFPSPQDHNSKTARLMDQLNPQLQIPNNQEKLLIPNQIIPPTDQIPASTVTTSPTLQSRDRTSFAQLITSLNTGNLSEKNPKKPRNFDPSPQDNSPSSILSVEMDMIRAAETPKGFLQSRDHQNYLSSIAENTSNSPGCGSYGIMGDLGRFQPSGTGFHAGSNSMNYMNNNNNNNNVSLTLGLPPSANSAAGNFEFGTRTETGAGNNNVNIGISQPAGSSHSNIGYHEILEFQSRKTFPSQLLPDFVA